MRKFFSLLLALFFLSNGLLLAGQSPQPQSGKPPQPQSPPTSAPARDEDEEGVVRIGTSLVQIDAIVTDRNGKIVRDLTAEDFEIYENKKKQDLTNFSFVSVGGSKTTNGSSNSNSRGSSPAEGGRTIVVIVDDLCIVPGDVQGVRNALRNLILNQVGPNDLVALIRTRAEGGTTQQLTNDKKLSLAGIERIWPGHPFFLGSFAAGPAIQNAIQSLKGLPGRKAVVLFSYGFSMTPNVIAELTSNSKVSTLPVIGDLLSLPIPKPGELPAFSNGIPSLWNYQTLSEKAARASVNIYPIFMGGLRTESINPTVNDSFDSTSYDALYFFAKETGGIPFVNTNGFQQALQRVLDDQSGYYLLGYSPGEEAFVNDSKKKRQFRSISIKVKRPGLTVRTRKGYSGVTDSEFKKFESPESKLVQTLISPFYSNGINVRLTPIFLKESPEVGGSKGIVRSLLYFDGKDLTFTDDGDGWKKAEVGLFAMMFDDNGNLLNKIGRNQTIRLRGNSLETALRNGFVFTLDLPALKAGVNQIRAAVKDYPTNKIGSAGQFFEAPKLEKDRISLSGLILSGMESKAVPNASAQLVPSEAPNATPAVREFVRGGGFSASCFVYNPVLHPETKKPAVMAQIKLYRQGVEVFAGKEFGVPISPDGEMELSRAIALPDSMEPGEYTAIVTVTDLYQTDAKRKTATQTLDFTLVSTTGK